MYTLTGPTDKMQPETKVQLRPEDRPAPREEPSRESQGKVKVAPIRIRFLGERPSDVNSRIQQEIADGLWDADDDDAMDVGFVMIRYNQMENENERSILGADFDKSDLTDPERRQLQKIAELRAKRAKLRSNSQRKPNRGTSGSNNGPSGNGSEALGKLEEQIDSLEQSLYDRFFLFFSCFFTRSVERRRFLEARRRGVRERLLDEEDSYYDRTDRKRFPRFHVLMGRTRRTAPESRAALQEKLAYKEKSLKFYRAELAASEAEPAQPEGDADDPLEQFMRENERKVRETKLQILREKIRTAEKDILDITNRLSEMRPPPTASEAAMNPPTPVLRLRGKESNARDTSTYTVINPTSGPESAGDKESTKNTKDSGEEGAKTANSSKSSKKSKSPSGAYLSSFGSVLESLKAGKNTSFDDQKTSSSSTSIAWKPSMNVAPNPANARKSKNNALYDGGSGSVEGVDVSAGADSKVRDMKEYHVPKDLNVAINKEALDEVVEELGSNQPAFMKRMISELKDK